jgi:hypothetical protein
MCLWISKLRWDKFVHIEKQNPGDFSGYLSNILFCISLCPNDLELFRHVCKVVCIYLGGKHSLLWFLNKVLVALLLSKRNCLFLCVEADALALHKVCTGLPAHQRVFPSVSLLQRIPINEPLVRMPCARLSSRFCGFVYACDESEVDPGSDGYSICAHRTVLACKSMGAPETTAAARAPPGSLPSRTRIGVGEKFLQRLQYEAPCSSKLVF